MNNIESLVSIIIPVYNVEPYLCYCLDSCINQTYKNLEIIVIDDGSTDDSGKICDEYALKDSRFKVIHKTNGGLSDARNKGIDIATGEYIYFLDSDDYISKNAIEHLLFVENVTQSDIVIGNYKKVYDSKAIGFFSEKFEEYEGIEGLINLYDKHVEQAIISANKLFKSNCIEKNCFPYGKKHEDEFTTYKLLYKAKKISYIYDEIYLYRQREGSITKEKTSDAYKDLLEAVKECAEFFSDKDDMLYKMAATRALFIAKVCTDKWIDFQEKQKAKECYTQFVELWRKYKNNNVLPNSYRCIYMLYSLNIGASYKLERILNKIKRLTSK